MKSLAVCALILAVAKPLSSLAATPETTKAQLVSVKMDDETAKAWLSHWEKDITGEARNRYCDKAMGEDLGWLMSHVMKGFYYGYLATRDPKWIDLSVDWTDAWGKRAVTEPDGFPGWPRTGAAGTAVDDLDSFNADSLLGEAMALKWIVLSAGEILKNPELEKKYGTKARDYLVLSERIYQKWDSRGAWRETKDGGMISIVLPFGIDAKTGQWTEGFVKRNEPGNGFSHPDNKANMVASWLLSMADVTQKAVYKERAERWFKLMKSRMTAQDDGTYKIWNYWEPAGPWDHKQNGSTKHWVGVHPNAGYYVIDTDGIVEAYEHGLVFTKEDVGRLVATAHATNREWPGIAPYDAETQKKIESGMKLGSWGAVTEVPWYLALRREAAEK